MINFFERIHFGAGQNAGQNRVGLVPSLQEDPGLLYSYLEITLISRRIKMQIGSCVPYFLDRVGNSESKNRGTMLDKMLGRMCNVY